MKLRTKCVFSLLVLGAFFGTAMNAHAAIYEDTFQWQVIWTWEDDYDPTDSTSVDLSTDDIFNLTTGDYITGWARYDDVDADDWGDLTTDEFTASITIGDFTMTQFDPVFDLYNISMGPSLYTWFDESGTILFSNTAYEFIADADGADGFYAANDPLFKAGTMEMTSQAAVPVPGAVWLFGSGVLALVGIRRRSRA